MGPQGPVPAPGAVPAAPAPPVRVPSVRPGGRIVILILVEILPELAPDASPTHRTELLQELDNDPNLTYLTNTRCIEITANGVVCTRGDIEAEDVILAVGMQALSDEARTFRPEMGEFAAIGDCVRVRSIENAIKEAYYAAVRL